MSSLKVTRKHQNPAQMQDSRVPKTQRKWLTETDNAHVVMILDFKLHQEFPSVATGNVDVEPDSAVAKGPLTLHLYHIIKTRCQLTFLF